jgi:hypothetical protein
MLSEQVFRFHMLTDRHLGISLRKYDKQMIKVCIRQAW